ncbi:hypothetical protein MHT86_02610 [Corynebacterium mastitidis]|nr:hypothetical protein [Corynebacterium mastitidis]MCH6196393.1 hypothetical protein [Corynebacterium mastitidis]
MNLPLPSAYFDDFSTVLDFFKSPGMKALIEKMNEQHVRMLEDFRSSLSLLPEIGTNSGIDRGILPLNLREYVDEIYLEAMYDFVEQEAIPLYLVPRGNIALRLIRAKGRAARRQVLSSCYESIIEDCAAVLENVDQSVIGSEVKFALDGLGAMRSGYPHSAQAMFTVTLDTLISRFYPEKSVRKNITNHKKGAEAPDFINKMDISELFVWLPVWNAHEEFWKHKGDEIPYYYSRHASVHSVSSRQFNKRNCVQVLMLVTSLIGYAEQVMVGD